MTIPMACPCVCAFNRLRSEFLRLTELSRPQVRLELRLDDVCPPERRQWLWAEFERAGLSLPPLEYPLWMIDLLSETCLGAVLGSFAAVLMAFATRQLVFLAIPFELISLAVVIFKATAPNRTVVPARIATVRLAVQWLARRRPFRQPGQRRSREEISLRVREIIADHLGVPLEQVTEETTFTDIMD